MGHFDSLADVIKANDALYGKGIKSARWFGEEEMRFFGTKLYHDTFVNDTFITSELPPYCEREYTVHEANFQGEISSPTWKSYRTLEEAKEAQARYLHTKG